MVKARVFVMYLEITCQVFMTQHTQGRCVRSMFFECDLKKCISAQVDKNGVGLKLLQVFKVFFVLFF